MKLVFPEIKRNETFKSGLLYRGLSNWIFAAFLSARFSGIGRNLINVWRLHLDFIYVAWGFHLQYTLQKVKVKEPKIVCKHCLYLSIIARVCLGIISLLWFRVGLKCIRNKINDLKSSLFITYSTKLLIPKEKNTKVQNWKHKPTRRNCRTLILTHKLGKIYRNSVYFLNVSIYIILF